VHVWEVEVGDTVRSMWLGFAGAAALQRLSRPPSADGHYGAALHNSRGFELDGALAISERSAAGFSARSRWPARRACTRP
jgi:hypothetical protein